MRIAPSRSATSVSPESLLRTARRKRLPHRGMLALRNIAWRRWVRYVLWQGDEECLRRHTFARVFPCVCVCVFCFGVRHVMFFSSPFCFSDEHYRGMMHDPPLSATSQYECNPRSVAHARGRQPLQPMRPMRPIQAYEAKGRIRS